MAGESGQPLRRVTVSAMPTRPPQPSADGRGFAPVRPHSARTGDDGRFTIGELPAGEYMVTARRAGYVDQDFGQATPGTPPRRVTVADGARVGPLAFQLIRGGVVTGRVVDEQGEPAERVHVRVVRSQRRGGHVRLIGYGMGATTDDQGSYRLFGLPPGEYLVVAEPGQRRFGAEGLQGVDVDIVPTYGPGTVNPAEALKVEVQPGVEAAMDVQLVAAKVATVRGQVLTSKGQPSPGGFVQLQLQGALSGPGRSGPVTADGRYEIGAVVPGTYLLVAQAMQTDGPFDEDGPLPEMAVQEVTVEGEDLTVPLTLSPGSTARGRIVIEGGDPSVIATRNLRLVAFPSGGGNLAGRPGRGKVAADLTFEMRGLRGEQVIVPQMLPDGWWLKDVRVSGEAALDGFDFGSGRALTNLEVVLSARPSGLTGTVTLPTGGTADDYAVVLFPEDESRWERIGPGPSGARVVRPDLNGAFRMTSIRPGRYYVAALPAAQADMGTLAEPDQLRQLAGRSRSIDVKDGELVPVTLTLIER